MCHLAGFEPYIVYEGSGEDLCGRLVSAGVGGDDCPLPISLGKGLMGVDQVSLPSVPLSDDFAESQIGAVSKRGQFQSEAARPSISRLRRFMPDCRPSRWNTAKDMNKTQWLSKIMNLTNKIAGVHCPE